MSSCLVNIMWAHGTLELLAVHSYCPNGQELKRAAILNPEIKEIHGSMCSQRMTDIIPGKICQIVRYDRA
jgi:hypothetical protein